VMTATKLLGVAACVGIGYYLYTKSQSNCQSNSKNNGGDA
jgi:hypothetical protein